MRIPIFAIVLVFVVWLNLKLSQTGKRDDDIKRAFWERENKANSTRRQSLDALLYIHVPGDLLPDDVYLPGFPAYEAARRILSLTEQDAKIVNLTGYTNTDLKLEYGPANLPSLMEYDANYTTLVTGLQDIGKALWEAGRYPEACRVLEFSLSTGTDITACYRLLIDLYRRKLMLSPEASREKISALLPVAESLRSLSKDSIVALVREACGT